MSFFGFEKLCMEDAIRHHIAILPRDSEIVCCAWLRAGLMLEKSS
jgi:hypothetical protein